MAKAGPDETRQRPGPAASQNEEKTTGRLRRSSLLTLFPSFVVEPFGGIQVSGREALRRIETTPCFDASAFYYEPQCAKWKNLVRAIRNRRSVDALLVWHLGLLKLAPFIATSNPRIVLFLHGIEAWRKQDAVTGALLTKTHLFLTNSDYTWNRFTAIHPAFAGKPHRTVHLGLGDALDSRQPAPDPPEEPPSALMIGRMRRSENYKGHREVIEAWPVVAAALPNAELRIVGDGDLRPELEQLAEKLGIAHRVRFYGSVPDSKKEELLRRCRSFVLPSGGEGFGLVYLEAMRLGRPCIVSNLDAGSEVVNPPEAGFAVDLHDSAQIAGTIVRVLSAGREWDEMSTRARQRYESRFTARHFGGRLLAALSTNGNG